MPPTTSNITHNHFHHDHVESTGEKEEKHVGTYFFGKTILVGLGYYFRKIVSSKGEHVFP